MNRLIDGLKIYLTNWKNLLTHTIVGIIILTVALYAPVSPFIRLGFLIAVILFNLVRMKYYG